MEMGCALVGRWDGGNWQLGQGEMWAGIGGGEKEARNVRDVYRKQLR